MTRRVCGAPGCDAQTTRYGAYCSSHKSRKRRHGAPDQRGITKFDLKPHLATARSRIEKNHERAIWTLLDRRWADLAEFAGNQLRGTRSVWSRKAAQEVVRLAGAVAPREIVVTVLAVYLMQEVEPHRYRSDLAFDTQLVRRIRALTEANAKFSTTKSGKLTRVYTELPPRVTQVIAQWIKGSLGTAGVWFAKHEKAQEARHMGAKEAHRQALLEIDFE